MAALRVKLLALPTVALAVRALAHPRPTDAGLLLGWRKALRGAGIELML